MDSYRKVDADHTIANPDGVVKIELPAEDGSFWDVSQTMVQWTMSIGDGQRFENLVTPAGAAGFIDRIEVVAGGQVVETVSDYARIHYAVQNYTRPLREKSFRRAVQGEGRFYLSKGGANGTGDALLPSTYTDLTIQLDLGRLGLKSVTTWPLWQNVTFKISLVGLGLPFRNITNITCDPNLAAADTLTSNGPAIYDRDVPPGLYDSPLPFIPTATVMVIARTVAAALDVRLGTMDGAAYAVDANRIGYKLTAPLAVAGTNVIIAPNLPGVIFSSYAAGPPIEPAGAWVETVAATTLANSPFWVGQPLLVYSRVNGAGAWTALHRYVTAVDLVATKCRATLNLPLATTTVDTETPEGYCVLDSNIGDPTTFEWQLTDVHLRPHIRIPSPQQLKKISATKEFPIAFLTTENSVPLQFPAGSGSLMRAVNGTTAWSKSFGCLAVLSPQGGSTFNSSTACGRFGATSFRILVAGKADPTIYLPCDRVFGNGETDIQAVNLFSQLNAAQRELGVPPTVILGELANLPMERSEFILAKAFEDSGAPADMGGKDLGVDIQRDATFAPTSGILVSLYVWRLALAIVSPKGIVMA